MLWLNPTLVMLGASALDNVEQLAVSRAPHRLATEWTDLGPHLAFADVPEQRVDLRIRRRLTDSTTLALVPGDRVAFTARRAPTAGAIGIVEITAQIVILGVDYTLSRSGGPTQLIHAIAISSDGASDPITERSVEGEI